MGRWMRHGALRLGLAVCLAVGLATSTGCSDDGGGPCSGLARCDTEGSTCDGDRLVTCAPNRDGCLVLIVEDCTADGGYCVDTGETSLCVDPMCDDPGCIGAFDGASACDGGNIAVYCDDDGTGCLRFSHFDCESVGLVCDMSSGSARCVSCADPECADASDGDSFCSGTEAITCNDDGNGCLVSTVEDCAANGQVCDDSSGTATCTSAAP